MTKRLRKTLVLLAKLAVAACLLWYVLGKVHWWDYTVTADGEELRVFALRSAPDQSVEVQVRQSGSGPLHWRRCREFRPVSLRTAQGQIAIVRDSRPDWGSPREYLVQLPDGLRRWLGLTSFLPGRRAISSIILLDSNWRCRPRWFSATVFDVV